MNTRIRMRIIIRNKPIPIPTPIINEESDSFSSFSINPKEEKEEEEISEFVKFIEMVEMVGMKEEFIIGTKEELKLFPLGTKEGFIFSMGSLEGLKVVVESMNFLVGDKLFSIPSKGFIVGFIVGIKVGLLVGFKKGFSVGLKVMNRVGEKVGLKDGE